MSNQGKLILTIANPDAVQNSHWDKTTTNEFTLTAIAGKITEIKVVSGTVLIIKFETGELRLDIGTCDLKNIKNVD
jgi:hypothetical protein